MSGHTPGPLERGYYQATDDFSRIKEHVAVMRPDGSLVALTGPSGDTQSEVDALLFAAAPDLLEACRAAHADLNAFVGGSPVEYPTIAKLCAAIAKAEGQSNPDTAGVS